MELKKVSFTQRDFDEMWLQELIRQTPSILPVSDIEPIFSPLISIGREVSTNVGSVDNLFISPGGYLTIVETKLWRNPEARRTVVGQIIDYAQDFTKWTYEDLDEQVKQYNIQFHGVDEGLVETVLKYDESLSGNTSSFIDNVYRNMKRGRFLLLIVGDGIRESVEHMVSFLNRYPTLSFTLAFVELQVYHYQNDDSRLVIPQVISRTKIIERTVVDVRGMDIKSVDVDIITKKDNSTHKRRSLDEVEYYNALRRDLGQDMVDFVKTVLEDMEELNCVIEWKSKSVMVKYPDGNQKYTLFGIGTRYNVFVGWLHQQIERNGFSREIGWQHYQRLADVFQNVHVNERMEAFDRDVHIKELQENYDQFVEAIQRAIDMIENLKD